MPEEMPLGSPEPQAPAKPSVAPDELKEYFRSIEGPFGETCAGRERDSNGTNGAFIGLFILSLIPVVPFVASKITRRYFPSKVVSFGPIHFHLASFWFWWVALFVLSLSMLLLAIKCSGVSAEEKKKWLSPSQMRFAYCYGLVDEIRKYKTNQMGRHIETALEYLQETVKSVLPVHSDPFMGRTEIYIAAGLNAVSGTAPKWYRLRPETELILNGFQELVPKLRDRLKDRKDLPEIELALTYLAAYLYLEIPGLSDSKPEARFEEGIQSLLIFAQQVTTLPPYSSEQSKPTPKQKLSLKFFEAVSRVSAPFSDENPLVAFLCWFPFLLVLFGGGLFVALRLFAVKMDSTIVTTLIGGPILGALTAVTIPRIGRRKGSAGN